MSVDLREDNSWLKPVGEVFLGLNPAAVIRRVVGVIEIVPSLSVLQLQGLTWPQFVEHYADEPAREGLINGWLAMAEKRVAPAFWPAYLPFKSGVIARLRPVENDSIISFVAHLSTAGHYDLLHTLLGTDLLSVMDRTIRTGQHLFRGEDGPLTDLQVKSLGNIIGGAEHTQQLLEDLHAAVLLPAIAAPRPQPLNRLLTFSMRDFTQRRITTQQLKLDMRLSSEPVYCHTTIRDSVHRLLETLLAGIAPQTSVIVSDRLAEDTVQVALQYTSQDLGLQVPNRIEPLELFDAGHRETIRGVRRLITTAHACLTPVGGRAWAEPHQGTAGQGAARIVLELPRWKGPLPRAAAT
ncbi:MAG: hypothetical protein EHM39_10980 [Chloroflexi bacterium]|nr:MAG: hypothetical protein EHM39_10980 [Chloroflexota bacterium]